MKKTLKATLLLCLTVVVLLSVVSCEMLESFLPIGTTTAEETTAESTPEVTTPKETTPGITTPAEIPPEEPVPESVAVAEAWNMLYNANAVIEELLEEVKTVNEELEKRYNVSTGTFYDPTASDRYRPKTNLLDFCDLLDAPILNTERPIPGSGAGVINRYIYSQRTDAQEYYTYAITLVKTQFDKLKDSAVFFAQSTVDLRAIVEQVEAMELDLVVAYNLISTTSLYNDKEDVRQTFLKDAAEWISTANVTALEVKKIANLYLTVPGQDFLNKESDCYFLPKIQETLNFYFNTQFAEGGDYYEYYKEGGQYYKDYNGEQVNATKYPVDLVQIQEDLQKECPLSAFDEENIWAQVQNSNQ